VRQFGSLRTSLSIGALQRSMERFTRPVLDVLKRLAAAGAAAVRSWPIVARPVLARTKAFGNALLTNRSPLAHTVAWSAQFDLHATAVIEAAGELLAVDPAPPVLGRCACLVDTLLAHKASAVVNLLKFALPSSITSIGTPSSSQRRRPLSALHRHRRRRRSCTR
jgi:hypothetical protein